MASARRVVKARTGRGRQGRGARQARVQGAHGRQAGGRRRLPHGLHGAGRRGAVSAALADTEVKAPRIPVVSNVDAAAHADPAVIKDLLAKQVTSPVLFEDRRREPAGRGLRAGRREFGPGKVIAGIFKRIDKTASVEACRRRGILVLELVSSARRVCVVRKQDRASRRWRISVTVLTRRRPGRADVVTVRTSGRSPPMRCKTCWLVSWQPPMKSKISSSSCRRQ